jgi:hypothetical protein
MTALDSSVLIAALVPTQAHSKASAVILREGGRVVSACDWRPKKPNAMMPTARRGPV